MFCAHLSHFGYAVQLLPERGFSYRACDEEMSKPLLVLTLLKIISRYQWYISLSISYLLSIVYLNMSKRSCIESINISHMTVLTITKIAVAIRFIQHPAPAGLFVQSGKVSFLLMPKLHIFLFSCVRCWTNIRIWFHFYRGCPFCGSGFSLSEQHTMSNQDKGKNSTRCSLLQW